MSPFGQEFGEKELLFFFSTSPKSVGASSFVDLWIGGLKSMYLDYKKKRKDDSQWGLILFKVHPSKIGFKLDSPSSPLL